MLNLNSILIGSTQPKVLGDFYQKVFARPAEMVEEGAAYGWQVGSTFFSVLEHSEMQGKSKDPGRVMFNLETDQVKEEFERIKATGATVVKEPYELMGGWIATFADPDGNYFQLMSPFDMSMMEQ
jgi:predicted enzyme related to lactoylglutathione lyase